MDAGQREPGEPRAHGNGGADGGHREVLREHVRQAEQILLVGAVAVQQDQQGLAGPGFFRLGPQDDGGGEGSGRAAKVMAPFLQLPTGNNLRWRSFAGRAAGYEGERDRSHGEFRPSRSNHPWTRYVAMGDSFIVLSFLDAHGSAALPEVRPRPEPGHAGPVRPIPRQPGRPREPREPEQPAAGRLHAAGLLRRLSASWALRGGPADQPYPGGPYPTGRVPVSSTPASSTPRHGFRLGHSRPSRIRPAVSGPGRLPVPGSVRGQPPVPQQPPQPQRHEPAPGAAAAGTAGTPGASAAQGYRARKLAELDQKYSDGKMSMEDYMAQRADIMNG